MPPDAGFANLPRSGAKKNLSDCERTNEMGLSFAWLHSVDSDRQFVDTNLQAPFTGGVQRSPDLSACTLYHGARRGPARSSSLLPGSGGAPGGSERCTRPTMEPCATEACAACAPCAPATGARTGHLAMGSQVHAARTPYSASHTSNGGTMVGWVLAHTSLGRHRTWRPMDYGPHRLCSAEPSRLERWQLRSVPPIRLLLHW